MKHLMAFALICCFSPVLANAEGKGDSGREWALLRGEWQAIAMKVDGKQVPKKTVKEITLTISDGKFSSKQDVQSFGEGKLEINPVQKPKELTLTSTTEDGEKKWLAIYEVKAETLKIAMAQPERGRPLRFDAPAASGWTYIELTKKPKPARN